MIVRDAVLEAAELGERFPDLCPFEVVEHVVEMLQLSAMPKENEAIYRVILCAHSHGEDAGLNCASLWGLPLH